MNMIVEYSSIKKTTAVFLFFLSSCLVLLMEIGYAGNERWKAIAGKTGEERILYDPDSIIPSGSRKSREEFDCNNKIVRDVEVISEKPNRPVIHTFPSSEWHGVVRETPRGELFKNLCR